MARNPVQFQKGISLDEFFSLYGTEGQCFDAPYRWRWPNGFVCPHCGHDRCCQFDTRKLRQCNRCHRQTSITAGTIFEATKLALTVWLLAIYLVTQDKKGVSAMKLHRHPGIDPLAHKFDGTSAPLTVRGHDARVGIGGQTGDEVSAVSVNPIKELIAEVAQVKEQRPPFDPRPSY